MSLNNKKNESIEESDLQSLLDNKVHESKTIDYKSALPDNSDDGKKEFLADVSSFANTSGGHLIFGIKEKAGIPTELSGLAMSDSDKGILRLENIIRDGIEPRIPGISTRCVEIDNTSQKIIVMHIPKSWVSPHRVKFKNPYTRFHSRNSAGKYRLDVSELRSAFALSETTGEHIRNFRRERLGLIVGKETPILLNDNPKIVLHIVPFDAFSPTTSYDIASNIKTLKGSECLKPIYASVYDHRYNFDGYLTYSRNADKYLQIFRNGIIEAVDTDILRERESDKGKLFIHNTHFEDALIGALKRYLPIQKQLGVEPPFIIMLSLLGVKGYTMGDGKYFRDEYGHPIEKNDLIIPEIMLESYDYDAAKIMKPIFDTVWNAAGWEKSTNYNDDGEWETKRR